MARYVDAIDLPIPIEEAFDYLADFSRTAEWDPGVSEARRLTKGKVRLGSRFEVIVAFFGQRIPLEYEITEFDRPSRLVLRGSDSTLTSIDEITFVSRPGGTRVTYEARIELVGIRRIADPVVDGLMQRVGRLAVRGLRERLCGSQRSTGGRAESLAVERSPGESKRPASPRRRTRNDRKTTSNQKPKGAA
ncbi:MAG: SRPBCC family protein [Proteobacteria bacterium]|nr:SRPBCC family protein [Pseudomonadota bacterium]